MRHESNQPCLVFAHYFGGSARSWKPLIDELDGKFDLVTPDLPGFGGTHPMAGPIELQYYARFLIAAAPSSPWIAVGHSMGGKIALAAAIPRPPGLVGLILIATSPPTPEPMTEAARLKSLLAFGDRAAATDNLAEITAGGLSLQLLGACVDDVLRVDRLAWDWWLERGSREDISAETTALDLPVLIVAGAADVNLGGEIAERVAKGLPGASLETIADAGHLVPLEQPAAVATAISSFTAHLMADA